LRTDESITELALEQSAAKLLPVNTICIALYGATIGKLGITTFPAATNQAVANLILNSDLIDVRYVFYFLKSARSYFIGLGQGGAQPNISQQIVRETKIRVAPLKEQKRIAEKLDSLLSRVDICRERLDRVPGILRRFRQSVLSAATSGKLTEDWRLKNSTIGKYRSLKFDDEAFDIPTDWDVQSLGELIDPSRPLCYGVVQPGHEAKGGIPLIRVQDLDAGTVRVDDLRTVTTEIDDQYRRSRVQSGDLLISVVGTIGRTAIVPDRFEGNIARAIARITCRAGVDSRWVNYWLNCNTLQWWLTKSSKEVARKTLNLGDLVTAAIAVPPEEEQREIVRRVSNLFAIADNLNKRTTNGQELVQMFSPSILSKAFRGELVSQDPDDEPASVLLDRMREQRQTSKANKPKLPTKQTPRAPKKKAAMTKSRFDKDVQGKPYLAGFMKGSKKNLSVEELFRKADLPLVDFYKQLDFEVKQKMLVDRDGQLEAA
jgi:type I restriction enzyme S subunit